MTEILTQIYFYGIAVILLTALIIWIIKEPDEFGILILVLLGLLAWPLLVPLFLLCVSADVYRGWFIRGYK